MRRKSATSAARGCTATTEPAGAAGGSLAGRSVTVLGAGIAGMAAAFALAQRGASVRVLEQAPALREVGAGLQISPNGTAVLAALGVVADVAACSVAIRAIELYGQDPSRPLQRMDPAVTSRDLPWLAVHRADLLKCLARGAEAAGARVELDRQIQSVEASASGARLVFADGSAEEVSLLIGADGLRGITRAALGPAAEAVFTQQTAWRAIVPLDAPVDPVVRVYTGSGAHLVVYPLRDRRVLNIVAVRERDEWVGEGWSQRADPAALREAFAGFPDPVQTLLGRVREAHLWGLFKRPVAERWHQGGVAILGDAAHPTLPFLAQGACMALEDAWSLAAALDDAPDPQAAFARYQKQRQARCVRIVAAADRNAWAFHLSPGPVRAAAHTALRLSGAVAPNAALARLRWLYAHDVTDGQAARSIQTGT